MSWKSEDYLSVKQKKREEKNICQHTEDVWCGNCINVTAVSQEMPDGTISHGYVIGETGLYEIKTKCK